jgi:hypothetical protein
LDKLFARSQVYETRGSSPRTSALRNASSSANGCGVPTIENNQQASATLPRATSPEALIKQLRARLHTPLIHTTRFRPPPPGYGHGLPWLYVGLTATHGGSGLLAQFYANLLAASYATQASTDKLPHIGGMLPYPAATPACQKNPTADRCPNPFGYGRINLQPGFGPGTTATASNLESDIRLGLASTHLVPVSITFVKPLTSLIPIVIAQTQDSHHLNLATQWETIFGPPNTLQASYLEITDAHGHPLTAQASINNIGTGIAWHRTKRP